MKLNGSTLPRAELAQFLPTPRAVATFDDIQTDVADMGDGVTNASFLVVGPEPSLGAERVLAPAVGDLSGIDGGANGFYTLGLANTAVAAGNYGDATHVAALTVDAKGRLTAAASTAITGIFLTGRATPIAGSKMAIRWLRDNATYPLEDEAGIWSGAVVTDHGISANFTNTDGGANAPCPGFMVLANNSGSPSDVVGGLFDSVARANNTTVFGANIIARGTGKSGCKFVGLEIDVEPAAGDTALSTSSAGLLINGFSVAIPGPAMQTGALGGGSFANGIVLGGLATTAAGVSLESTSSADSLVNSGVGTFTTAAIKLGSGLARGIKWVSGSSLYFDGTNQRLTVPSGGNFIIRDHTDATSLATFDDFGNVTLAGTVAFPIGLSSTTATAGAQTLPANPVGFLTITIGGTNRKIPYYAT